MPNLPDVSPAELAKLLEGPQPPRLLDVREPAEFTGELGHIAGAEHLFTASVIAGAFDFSGSGNTAELKTSADIARWYAETTQQDLARLAAAPVETESTVATAGTEEDGFFDQDLS